MPKKNSRAQLLRILAEVGQYRTGLRKRWDVTVSGWGPDMKYGPKPHSELPESSAARWQDAIQDLDEMSGLIAQARELAEHEYRAHLTGTCDDCAA